jgi:hypothetical protein
LPLGQQLVSGSSISGWSNDQPRLLRLLGAPEGMLQPELASSTDGLISAVLTDGWTPAAKALTRWMPGPPTGRPFSWSPMGIPLRLLSEFQFSNEWLGSRIVAGFRFFTSNRAFRSCLKESPPLHSVLE